jgi:hypothetical protein
VIDPDIYIVTSRGLYLPNSDLYTVGFSTHKLEPLLSSSVFSLPAHLIQMDAGGSIGHQISDVQSWGNLVGNVYKTQSTRTFYRKQYCICPICDDPIMKPRMLWGQFRAHGVKRPVVRHMYIERHGIYMMWRYIYKPTRFIGGLQKLKELSLDDDFESAFTFDLIAASDTSVDSENPVDVVRNAHSLNFLYNQVRPALLTAHSEPSPMIRREWTEVP